MGARRPRACPCRERRAADQEARSRARAGAPAAVVVAVVARMTKIEHYVRRLAARRVPVPRIVRLTGLPIKAVEAILRGAPWRHLAALRAIGDLFSKKSHMV